MTAAMTTAAVTTVVVTTVGGDNGGGDNGGGDMPYTPSSSGEAIISMARGTYWQSIDLDRLNKCMGDRRMAEGDNGPLGAFAP